MFLNTLKRVHFYLQLKVNNFTNYCGFEPILLIKQYLQDRIQLLSDQTWFCVVLANFFKIIINLLFLRFLIFKLIECLVIFHYLHDEVGEHISNCNFLWLAIEQLVILNWLYLNEHEQNFHFLSLQVWQYFITILFLSSFLRFILAADVHLEFNFYNLGLYQVVYEHKRFLNAQVKVRSLLLARLEQWCKWGLLKLLRLLKLTIYLPD